MTTLPGKRAKTPRNSTSKQERTALIVAALAAVPPLIIAIVELLKTGRALGWW